MGSSSGIFGPSLILTPEISILTYDNDSIYTSVLSKCMAKHHLTMPFGTKTYRVFCQQQFKKDISSKCVCVCVQCQNKIHECYSNPQNNAMVVWSYKHMQDTQCNTASITPIFAQEWSED